MNEDRAAKRRRLVAALAFVAAAVGVSAGGFFGAQEAAPTESAAAATTINVGCGTTIPTSVAADTTVHVAGPCTYNLSVALRIPYNNVRYEFEPGVTLNGGGVAGNIFYLNGGDDAQVVGLDGASKVRFINADRTVIYTSTAERFLIKNVYVGTSGSDAGTSKLDHGIYIDGSLGWRVEDFEADRITGHGIQIYSGSSRITTGLIQRAKLHHNGGDGLHFGNASKDVVATSIESYNNGFNGVRSYAGTGNKLQGPNWIYANTLQAVRQDVPLALVQFTAGPPPTEPPPPPPPPPPPACDQACVDDYEAQLNALENLLVASETQVASLQSALDAEKATTASLRARLAQIHELSG